MSKICFYFESYCLGGLDTFSLQLINNWRETDQIVLLCNKSHAGAEYLLRNVHGKNASVEIYTMPMVADLSNQFELMALRKFVYLLSFIFCVPYYILFSYKKLNLQRFDKLFVINGGYPAGISSRCVAISWWLHTKKKSIHNFHNFVQKSHWTIKLYDFIIDVLLNKSVYKFASVSKICAESLRTRFVFKKNTNITYVYNGVDSSIVIPSFDLHSDLGINKDVSILIMLATYEKRKGHKFIIDVINEVLKKNKMVHMVFCGYGSESEMAIVKEYIHKLSLEEFVTLFSYKENAFEYLAQAKLLLIGSQSLESFGLTAIEAMKYKKVVLSTNTGGLKEVIIDGEGGYTFNIDDVSGMANKILQLLDKSNSRLLKEQELAGYNRFLKEFSVNKMVMGYERLLDDL